ncbi:DUF2309 domain-containing protein [Robiginitalea sp. M366]|uniref:YbcC family protein n=1 Tax=Robiginitalea aestuariiviva TaxID=3036903 RepID=UPI00240D4814|nr:DUF2309 domain-containing protein [Robiginitalea aestuariiviva]MDG1572466.1 DUF2309 domain-containing protein [Robiginitalea aestuariiviva]
MHHVKTQKDAAALRATLSKGTEKIAPLWALEHFVAVNPYMGLAARSFADAAAFMQHSAGARATLPLTFYREALEAGRLTREDLARALERLPKGRALDLDTLLEALYTEAEETPALAGVQTLAQVAGGLEGKQWARFMVDRVSFWAGAYYDKNQALWNTAGKGATLFEAWKKEAEVDYSPEAMGLKGFRNFVKHLPSDPLEAAALALEALEVPEAQEEAYLTALLMQLKGWAGIAARQDWDAGLAGSESHMAETFLCILLVWEMALKELLPYPELEYAWHQARKAFDQPDSGAAQRLHLELVLQEAFDLASQRQLIQKLHAPAPEPGETRKGRFQVICCIDVRSEVFRRNLEAAHPEAETLGFAGFFAFPVAFKPLAHTEAAAQCPVLLTPSHTVHEALEDEGSEQRAIGRRRLMEHVTKAWKSFKLGAITCFGFVGPVGLAYLPKLFTDTFGLTRPVAHPDQAGLTSAQSRSRTINLDATGRGPDTSGISLEDRIAMAAGALRAMSLTEGFGRVVVIAGHGASTVNNPHATGLDCGACGGHTGEANARVAAQVLNQPEVRQGLQQQGIHLPDATLFVAALHDTTTDRVSLFTPAGGWPQSHTEDIRELRAALERAGEASRAERALRMDLQQGNLHKRILQRSRDWSQVRPEWGLAGCSAFVVAPRERTAHLDLEGKAFLHNYTWQQDPDFKILELIMTAPMVVTSWINLQYYASTVDPRTWGAGNKTLHNVVAGLGVLEGYGGDLRVGLPWQSVHDGQRFQHEPRRLSVVIEAPVDQMSRILGMHQGIRQLCDNGWIFLYAMDGEGRVAYRYAGHLEWEKI